MMILSFSGTPILLGNTANTPQNVEEGYVTADDGVRLFYRRVGSGSQTVIVPLGFILFEDFKRLATGRTLIFYDMRNRGRSDAVRDPKRLTIHDDVTDLEKIRRHFSLSKVSIIGESYLGLMVVMYAMQHPAHADRLVQIGPVPRKFGTEYPAHLTAQDSEPVMDAEEVKKLEKLIAEGYRETHPKDYCEKEWLVVRPRLVGRREDAPKLGKGHCDLPNEWPVNLRRHLEYHFVSVQKLAISKEQVMKVGQPVLTIHGTRDRNAPYGAGREWASTLPNARLLTVTGAAHLPWIEEPDLVFSSIDTFLKGSWPRQAQRIVEGK
jgi:proline iminopeptidase